MHSSTLQCELLSEAASRSGQSTETVRRRGAEAGRDCKCNEDEHRSEYIRVVLFLSFFFLGGFGGGGGGAGGAL